MATAIGASATETAPTTMAKPTKPKKWSDVKARLKAFDHKALVSLLGELYNASVANRRFLHSRLTPESRAIEEYRRLVADAIYPDPFSKRRVGIRDAAAAIVDYRRSTDDTAGTVDLMLTFVEAGTEQAADLGYGDEAYFNALQNRLDAVATEFDTLPADVRAKVRARLARIRMRAQDVGWGFSDAVDDVIHALDTRAKPVRAGAVNRRRSRRGAIRRAQ